jgi:hypothetical protein
VPATRLVAGTGSGEMRTGISSDGGIKGGGQGEKAGEPTGTTLMIQVEATII